MNNFENTDTKEQARTKLNENFSDINTLDLPAGSPGDNARFPLVPDPGFSELSYCSGADLVNYVNTSIGGAFQPASAELDTFAANGSAFYLSRANHTGTQSADTLTDGTTNKAYTATEKTKLAGVATGATANSSDATLLNRANHTGTQPATTITSLPEPAWFLLSGPEITTAATTGAKAWFTVAKAFTLSAADTKLRAETAPTGASLIVDIEKNGVSIYSTRPAISAGSNTGSSGTMTTDPTSFAADDTVKVYIGQVGATVAGAGTSWTWNIKQ